MKHYFLVAKDVGDLTTILCSALEIEQLKPSPGISQLFNPLNWRTRRQHPRAAPISASTTAGSTSPTPTCSSAIPSTSSASSPRPSQTDAFLHPDAIRLLRRSLRLIDDELRNDPEANRIFLELLSSDKQRRDVRCGA